MGLGDPEESHLSDLGNQGGLPRGRAILAEAWMIHSEVQVAQSYLTLCDPMDYTVHGILQARIPEWVAFPFSRESSQPRDQTQVSHIAGRFFTSWTSREAHIRRDPHMQPMVGSSILLVGQVTQSTLRTNVEKMSRFHYPETNKGKINKALIFIGIHRWAWSVVKRERLDSLWN